MVLNSPSVPYSLKIDGEWCRIIHNNQQRVCLQCHAVGHSQRKCPAVICKKCSQRGHLSFDCETPENVAPNEAEVQSENPVNNNTDATANTTGESSTVSELNAAGNDSTVAEKPTQLQKNRRQMAKERMQNPKIPK